MAIINIVQNLVKMFGIVNIMILIISSVLVFIFISYVNIMYALDIYRHWLYNDAQQLQEYDYIVVGAGTAGTILAANLDNNGQNTLLVEAGGHAPPFLDIPLLSTLLQKTPYDWQYATVPQMHACKALLNNQSRWPMGRIIGGSSRLNYMTYVRGHPQDYKGWFPDYIEHQKDAALNIEDLKWSTILADTVLEGVKEMGYQVGNINEHLKTGFMKPQLTMKNGKRWSVDKILNQKQNSALTVITHAHVNKILIKANKAVGIIFAKLGKIFKATAKKGVILSGGAIGSPKLLMLSGIGPKAHLQRLNITVLNDLPVGQNLVDHLITGMDLVTLNTSLPFSLMDALNPTSALSYFFFGQGPWTSAGIEVLGTFHSSMSKNMSSLPDLQLMVFPAGVSNDHGIVIRRALGITDKVYNQYFAPLTYKNAVTIAPVLLHPKSIGEIKLQSSNPLHDPLINPRYLSEKDDVTTLLYGLQFVKKLIKTNAMKALGATLYEKKFPGCETKEFDSEEYWRCYIQHLTLSSYHPAGTCSIGKVVDTSFRVYNMTNLYVVDASVLPVLPSGNISAAIVMLAEKAAYLLEQIGMKEKNSFYKCNYSYKLCDIFHIYCNMCMSAI